VPEAAWSTGFQERHIATQGHISMNTCSSWIHSPSSQSLAVAASDSQSQARVRRVCHVLHRIDVCDVTSLNIARHHCYHMYYSLYKYLNRTVWGIIDQFSLPYYHAVTMSQFHFHYIACSHSHTSRPVHAGGSVSGNPITITIYVTVQKEGKSDDESSHRTRDTFRPKKGNQTIDI
jgi:hypothetical protein